ncbi:MAG: hypothetical protein RBQ97_08575 [Acholeplasma sp.]|nr:hypothetical protein [Acholeplasma sp.]
MNILIGFLIATAVMFLLLINGFLFWTLVFIPIKKKDKVEKQREQAYNELREIQAEKSIEWDKYKQLTEEVEKLRDSYVGLQKKYNSKQEEVAKLEVSVENLKAANKEKTEIIKKKEKPTK